ncbi:GNAT family N-acetyltransferase [candidate division KSB1 bacterium]|nr:GNAT family N-acetyltransferase [candidate division KSB1 bacterium]
MEALTIDDFNVVIDLLKKDRERNINILNFIETYAYQSYERVGNSVLLRGVSDHLWVFISSNSQAELRQLAARLTKEDIYFAAIEDWMVSLLIGNRKIAWDLNLIQYILPKHVLLPKPMYPHLSLNIDDALYVCENSDYQDYFSVEYVEDRISRGPSAAIYEKDQLVAWALTQDDGAIGFLHVLESHRKKGYGYQITLGLSEQIRSQGKRPFAYIKNENTRSIKLVRKLGFIEQKQIQWFKLA